MSMTDPIADFLTRLRNALAAKHATCEVGASQVKEQLARILTEEGYLAGFEVEGEGPRRKLRVKLKYAPGGRRVIQGLERVSRPGRRIYRGAAELAPVLNGLGLSIVSTSRGILPDREARSRRLGGEVICNVW
jgi:small subunit ribosomal protein S8